MRPFSPAETQSLQENALNSSWKGRKVLVTGGGGFIGSHLVERLLDLEADVTAFVHYNAIGSRGHLDSLPLQDQQRITVCVGDLRDRDSVDEAVRDREIVFHLAAMIAIPFSQMRPALAFENNIQATLNVVLAARKFGVQRLIHTSSSEVYGTAQRAPIDEDHPLEAQSPYAASKIACDKLVQSFHRSYGLPAVTLRPFNTYGPRQSARAIIPTIITQALTRDQVMLGAMHPTRDLNYVSDTVQGFLKIAQTPGIEGRVYNIGRGKEISIGDLADRIIALVGRKVPVTFDAERIRPQASEVGRLICDSSRARADFGWQPEVSLDDGLKMTIEWIGSHIAGYRPESYTI
jgi:NAD dependent epimerase/dehydratase